MSVVLVCAAVGLNAQVWLSQNFDEAVFPPEGWSVDNHQANWGYTLTNYAGGMMGEISMKTLPKFTDTTRFISPVVDVSGAEHLTLYFKHTLKVYQYDFKIGVAVRSGSGNWTSVLEINGSSIKKKEVYLSLDTPENASQFQFCFYYIGSSDKMKMWAIDNVTLFERQDNDMVAKSIDSDVYYDPSDDFTPKAKVFNNGLNKAVFDVTCYIYDTDNNLLYSETKEDDTLDSGLYRDISFSSFTLPETPDEAYHLVVFTSMEGESTLANDTIDKYIYVYVTHPHDLILLEIGTATWCTACPYASEAADSLVRSGQNVAVVEYHFDDDYTTTATNNRCLNYYSMIGFPSAYFDGVLDKLGAGPGIYQQYYNYFAVRSNEKTGVSLSLKSELERENVNLTVMVSKQAPAFNKNTAVHLIITESHIPESWQGEEELNDVCRLMLPDENGTMLDLSGSDNFTFNYSFTRDESWNIDELEVVAFIQDNDSHEVLNVTKAKLTDLLGVGKNEDNDDMVLSGSPNPFANSVNIGFTLKQSEFVSIEAFDFTGKKVAVIVAKKFQKGKQSLRWEPDDKIPPGVYFIKMEAGNNQKVIKVIKSIQ